MPSWAIRLATCVDSSGATTYTYTAAVQLLTGDGPPQTGSSDTVSNSHSNRIRSGLSLQQPAGTWTNGFHWDLAKRLRTVTSEAGTFAYTYTGVGQSASPALLVQQLTLPNGAYISNAFDTVGRELSTKLYNSS